MIFIGLFLLIVVVVMALNIHNHSNLDEIEKYLVSQNCKEYLYSRGSYKALCEKNFLEVKNSFNVDIENNSRIIKYEEMKTISIKELKIVIDNYELEFKDKNDLNFFYEKLKIKLNKQD